MVRAVDDRHVDVGAPQRPGREQAGEAGADDRDPVALGRAKACGG
jgi:hypothetical protein